MRTCRQFDVSPGFLFSLATALLLLPLNWFFALTSAALFHEACHLLALRLLGGQAQRIHLDAGGAVIQALPLSTGKALLCTLAGPMGSLLLLLLARWFPRLALCAAVQSAFNLLPVGNSDGSHALEYCAGIFLPPRTVQTLCRGTALTLLILIAILGFYGTWILKLGILPALTAGYLVIKGRNGKIPCKSDPMRVQ